MQISTHWLTSLRVCSVHGEAEPSIETARGNSTRVTSVVLGDLDIKMDFSKCQPSMAKTQELLILRIAKSWGDPETIEKFGLAGRFP